MIIHCITVVLYRSWISGIFYQNQFWWRTWKGPHPPMCLSTSSKSLISISLDPSSSLAAFPILGRLATNWFRMRIKNQEFDSRTRIPNQIGDSSWCTAGFPVLGRLPWDWLVSTDLTVSCTILTRQRAAHNGHWSTISLFLLPENCTTLVVLIYMARSLHICFITYMKPEEWAAGWGRVWRALVWQNRECHKGNHQSSKKSLYLDMIHSNTNQDGICVSR